ncbi:hypothetical protein F511_36399 [Dorcoceras hygrometricum]|uniref:Uncharacterized protein n=1 Tax=Dorcoceras hygrometricum TaxID=472368 RepID=A0A2Z7D270_9LAMI|nr:hypothetical protein F511_36399 [Dorcoceras hygrometricum]
MTKRWDDVRIESIAFSVSGRLLPVGSINFCRYLSVDEPAYRVDPRQPTVFAFRLSQFCTIFVDYSLFSGLPTEDIRSFVGSITLERTVLRSVQIPTLSTDSQHVQLPSSLVFESPIVQIEQSAAFADTYEQMDIDLFDDSSLHFDDNDAAVASISLPAAPIPNVTEALAQLFLLFLQIMDIDLFDDSSLHFDDNDAAVASISLPAAPIPNVTEALAQLRASIEQISERDDGAKHKDTLLLNLHDFERQVTARFDAHDIIANTDLDVVDVRRVVREHYLELNAKINSLDEQVAATRNDLLEFSAQAQQTLNIITDQLSELVAYINRGGNDKKGEVRSSRGPRTPPEDQNRGSGNTGGGGDTVRTTDIPQRDIDTAQRNIPERLMNADRERQRERERSRSGSHKRRRY